MRFKKALILLPLIALVAASCNKSNTASNTQDPNTSGSSVSSNSDTLNGADNSGTANNGQTSAPVKPTSLTVTLGEQNKSKETGTATLSETNGQVTVVLNLTGATKGVAQPAHIHTGTCAKLGAVKYPLNTPTNGVSTTVIDNVTISDLLATSMAINVHKSTALPNAYVACGDIIDSTASGTTNGLPNGQ